MSFIFLTYGDDNFINSRKRIVSEASKLNIFDKIYEFKREDIILHDKSDDYKNIFNMSKGGGYWIWKPYILKKVMDDANYNDIIIYADAGCSFTFNNNLLDKYIKILEHKSMIRFELENKHSEEKWTNEKIFEFFNISDNNIIRKSPMLMATVIIFKKTNESIKLINNYFSISIEYPLLFTDFYNNYKKTNLFIDNRHDQSIFSILTKLNNDSIEIINDETYPPNNDNFINASRIRN